MAEFSQRQQELDKQKKELEELCKAMATDTELPDVAVDSEGLGAGSAEDHRILLQESKRCRCQSDEQPRSGAREESLMRMTYAVSKQSVRRRKGSSQGKEMKGSDHPETPRSAPHGHVESRRSGRRQFGTVLGFRENDDALGCDAFAGKRVIRNEC